MPFTKEYKVDTKTSKKFILVMWLVVLIFYLFNGFNSMVAIVGFIALTQTYKSNLQNRFKITRISSDGNYLEIQYLEDNQLARRIHGDMSDFEFKLSGNPFQSRLPGLKVLYKGIHIGVQHVSISWSINEMNEIISMFSAKEKS
ncbi:MAG: hypothetical protein RL660_2375 [Bacteroidota bacterium]|jgi:hypothetical protein